MNLFRGKWAVGLLCLIVMSSNLFASEVIEETKTRVIIREHPKTGKPYVSIVSTENPEPPDPFTGQRGRILRPDYRMLDPKVKSGEIPYDGPYSDQKKIYIFAATLATLGALGGAVIYAAAPAATGVGAASGAGTYLAAGTAVTAAPVVVAAVATRPDRAENYVRESAYRPAEKTVPNK